MENIFIQYMNNRLHRTEKDMKSSGPVITISRQTGCPGSEVAEMLVNLLNENKGETRHWRVINKEILNLAAKELQSNPEQINEIMQNKEIGIFESLINSFTERYYLHESKVRKVITEVIRSIANEGNVVLVGRGSGIITWNMPKSLHISLEAPINWRINQIVEKMGVSFEKASEYITSMDNERNTFRASFKPKNDDTIYYHLKINCERYSNQEICSLILAAAQQKKVIE